MSGRDDVAAGGVRRAPVDFPAWFAAGEHVLNRGDDAESTDLNRSTLNVRPIGWTHFEPPDDVDWSTDADGGAALAEFAGRACYQSWNKPNPATATNAGYLAHILEVGHFSVLEHGTVTVYITGVSRSLTHELVRHRHFSYSQLSQRYVNATGEPVVEPDVIAADPELHILFLYAVKASEYAYRQIVERLTRRRPTKVPCPECKRMAALIRDPVGYECKPCGKLFARPQVDTAGRKAARQAARSVLLNAAETRIVVTGNYRAWRHFVRIRATEAADVEIRALAIECLRQLQRVAPNVFADFRVSTLPDGTEVATTETPPDDM